MNHFLAVQAVAMIIAPLATTAAPIDELSGDHWQAITGSLEPSDGRETLLVLPEFMNPSASSAVGEGSMVSKRGFGSMMPAYLVHLYRPDLPQLTEQLVLDRVANHHNIHNNKNNNKQNTNNEQQQQQQSRHRVTSARGGGMSGFVGTGISAGVPHSPFPRLASMNARALTRY